MEPISAASERPNAETYKAVSDLFGQEKPRVAKDLLAVYDAVHREKFSVAAPIVGKKDGPLAARLLTIYNFDQLSSWVRLYFDVPDKFIQQGGYTFGVFSSCIGKIIQYDRRLSAQHLKRPEPSQNLRDIRKQVDDEWRSR